MGVWVNVGVLVGDGKAVAVKLGMIVGAAWIAIGAGCFVWQAASNPVMQSVNNICFFAVIKSLQISAWHAY